MSTISTQLRNFKDPTREQITELYFCIPPADAPSAYSPNGKPPAEDVEHMDINATLSAGPETEEESYVRMCCM
jgi:hypothetical protein